MVYAHLDSTTFVVHGAYDSAYAEGVVQDYEAVEIRRGYSLVPHIDAHVNAAIGTAADRHSLSRYEYT